MDGGPNLPCPVDRLLARGGAFVVCFCGRRLYHARCDACGYEAPEARARRAELERDERARQARDEATARRRRAWGYAQRAKRRRRKATR